MNVAVKAGQSQLALDTYQRMRMAGCDPNLVTYVSAAAAVCFSTYVTPDSAMWE
jgi:pentatricopeptide repeat protein